MYVYCITIKESNCVKYKRNTHNGIIKNPEGRRIDDVLGRGCAALYVCTETMREKSRLIKNNPRASPDEIGYYPNHVGSLEKPRSSTRVCTYIRVTRDEGSRKRLGESILIPQGILCDTLLLSMMRKKRKRSGRKGKVRLACGSLEIVSDCGNKGWSLIGYRDDSQQERTRDVTYAHARTRCGMLQYK